MKKFLGVLAILSIATPALAVTGTITWTDAQNTRFDRDRLKINGEVCASVSLPANCTQAQARTAFCARPGSSSPTSPCTVAGQSSTDILVYGDVAEYLDKYVITRFFFPNLKQSQNIEDKNNFAKWQETATTEQKNAVCLAAGLAAGCLP